MATEPPPDYLFGTEAAKTLRVHPVTITAMIARGELRGIKVARRWRIPREDVDALLAGTA
jgi:excisionase family DNA binding protein